MQKMVLTLLSWSHSHHSSLTVIDITNRSRIEYLLPSSNIIVLFLHFHLTNNVIS